MSGKTYLEDFLNFNDEEPKISDIAKFYEGCNIFITGGSGFLGKLLIEKVIRVCPKVGKLFVLMRSKGDETAEKRLEKLFKNSVFETLHRTRPNFFKHIVLIKGDVSKSDLGLSPESRKLLYENTHIVFHFASVVSFDDSFRNAIYVNVRGPKLMLELAKEMKNLKGFLHLSTAFSHCELNRIEEKFYKPLMDLAKIFSLLEILEDKSIKRVVPDLIQKLPNVNTFSKALGEEVIRLHSSNLPICIVRPSMVISTWKEPLYDWSDGMFRGITGILATTALSVTRVIRAHPDMITNLVPADYMINNCIVALWDTVQSWNKKSKDSEQWEMKLERDEPIKDTEESEVTIYNCVSTNAMTWGEFIKMNMNESEEVPSSLIIWYPILFFSDSRWLFQIYWFIFHTLPGVFFDGIALIIGSEPKFLKMYCKVKKICDELSYFTMRQWEFSNDNVSKLWKKLSSVDQENFDFNMKNVDWHNFAYYNARGIRFYLLNDPMSTLSKGRLKLKLFKILHYTVIAVFWIGLIWATIMFLDIDIDLNIFNQKISLHNIK